MKAGEFVSDVAKIFEARRASAYRRNRVLGAMGMSLRTIVSGENVEYRIESV